MTFEQLRIFIEVAEREHLTRAAEQLRLTPSAVSSAIKTLEDRYGVILFHRIGRRIELTAEGRIFLDEARATMARAQNAELMLTELGGGLRGRLSIYASQTIAGYWLPPVLARFRANYPAVDITLTIGNTEYVTQATHDGSADIGFVEGSVTDEALSITHVAQDQLILVTSASHPWAKRKIIAWQQLQASDWILREHGSGTRSVFENAMRAAGFIPEQLHVVLELPSNEAVCSAVMAGQCATVISERVVAAHIATGALVQICLPLPPRHFLMLRHRERYRSKAQDALIKLLNISE